MADEDNKTDAEAMEILYEAQIGSAPTEPTDQSSDPTTSVHLDELPLCAQLYQ